MEYESKMVPVEKFAKANGIPSSEVIENIRNGSCKGYVKDDKWYIELSQSVDEKNSTNNNSGDLGSNAAGVIALFITALSVLLIIGITIGAHGKYWIISIGSKLLAMLIFSGMGAGVWALFAAQEDSGKIKVILGFLGGCIIIAIVFYLIKPDF